MKNSGVIVLDYIQTSKNLADPFTKGLSRNMIDKCIEGDGYETHNMTFSQWSRTLCDRRSRELDVEDKLLIN